MSNGTPNPINPQMGYLQVRDDESEKVFLKNAKDAWKKEHSDFPRKKVGRRSTEGIIFAVCQEVLHKSQGKLKSQGDFLKQVKKEIKKSNEILSDDTIHNHVTKWIQTTFTFSEMPYSWKHRWLLSGTNLETTIRWRRCGNSYLRKIYTYSKNKNSKLLSALSSESKFLRDLQKSLKKDPKARNKVAKALLKHSQGNFSALE